MSEKKFEQQKYITKYNKENYVNFSLKIKPELNNKIVNYCKSNNISRPEFLERAIEALNHNIQWYCSVLCVSVYYILWLMVYARYIL